MGPNPEYAPDSTTPPPKGPEGATPGLGGEAESQWPKVSAATESKRPIDMMEPKSEAHARVLQYMLARLEHSERAMSVFYPRWQINEKKMQAYINLGDIEKELKRLNDSGEPPKIVSVVVPYEFATITSIVTYLSHVFTGRRPMFSVGSYKMEAIKPAGNMETMLQYQADVTRLAKQLYLFLLHGQVYGIGVLRTYWKELYANRTIRTSINQFDLAGQISQVPTSRREVQMIYQGNMVEAQDPYFFFPDPRVPLTEVNRRGEYVFWRMFEGKHILKREEAAGNIKWVDWAGEALPKNDNWAVDRINVSGGEAIPALAHGHGGSSAKQIPNFYQVDQGTVELIPAEIGIGTSRVPEKWIVTILNKQQIVQLDKFDVDHGMHPCVVSEPYQQGMGFGNLGLADYIGPIQDSMGWFINSHIDNVRRVLNDSMIYDPSAVEEKDLKRPGPGRLIRLKQAAIGRDVRTIIQQLPVASVTSAHVKDLELLFSLGERVSAASDNFQGMQDQGGRKTATEVRSSNEFAVSRLAHMAKLISAQAVVDLTEQMSVNTQQYISDTFYLTVLGADGARDPITIRPEMLVGNFHYPVQDGTLPVDKVAMLDVWREIFTALLQDPQLRMAYDVPKIFEYVAELGGAKNIQSFRLVVGSPEQIAAGVQAGNMVPANQFQGGRGGQVSGVTPNPGRRMQGAL